MPRHIHKLSNVDTENARAECANCGSVDIKLKANQSPRCMIAYKADRARYDSKRVRDYVSPEHGVKQSHALKLKSENPCFICGESDVSKLCIDHDHATGSVRGILCHLCNTALGSLRDDPVRLTRALRYLETPPLLGRV